MNEVDGEDDCGCGDVSVGGGDDGVVVVWMRVTVVSVVVVMR